MLIHVQIIRIFRTLSRFSPWYILLPLSRGFFFIPQKDRLNCPQTKRGLHAVPKYSHRFFLSSDCCRFSFSVSEPLSFSVVSWTTWTLLIISTDVYNSQPIVFFKRSHKYLLNFLENWLEMFSIMTSLKRDWWSPPFCCKINNYYKNIVCLLKKEN